MAGRFRSAAAQTAQNFPRRPHGQSVDDPCVERYGITRDYLAVMDIPVVAGRAFTEADTTAGQPVIAIAQSTAKAVFGNDDPIGAQIRIGDATRGPWRTVIGVVADVHHDDLTAPHTRVYVAQTQFTDSTSRPW
jgi:hypothetical protein